MKMADVPELTSPNEEIRLGSPYPPFFRFAMWTIIFMCLWVFLNTLRLVLEKRKMIESKEKKAIQKYRLITETYNKLMRKQNRRSLQTNWQPHKPILYQKRQKGKCNKALAKLWNNLQVRRTDRGFDAEMLKSSQREEYVDCVASPVPAVNFAAFSETGCRELSVFVPPLHSTECDDKEVDLVTKVENFDVPQGNDSGPLTLQMLNNSFCSNSDIDHHPGLLASHENDFPDIISNNKQSLLSNEDIFGFNPGLSTQNVTDTRDSGYQGFTQSEKLTSSDIERKVSDFIEEMVAYNEIKEAEMFGKMQEAQVQIKSEIDNLKTAFRLPPESVEFTRSQIMNCAPLQTRKKMLHQVKKRIKVVKKEIRTSKQEFKNLTKPKRSPPDEVAKLMISLAWQEQQEKRFDATYRKIIECVKSTMEVRFRGMTSANREIVKRHGQNWCYDCASGRHDKVFVDGIDGCPPEGDRILSERDGFDENCTTVKIINSWFNELHLRNYCSTKTKADKIEQLHNRVLKAMYLKRYYERGQLFGTTYLTVWSGLEQFVKKSPKESIPVSTI